MADQHARIALDIDSPADAAEGAMLRLVHVRPRLRGVNHAIAFPLSLIATIVLTYFANGTRGHWSAFLFGAGVTLVFGTSATYHRVTWPDHWAVWCRRIDHSAIFVCNALVYTALYVGALRGDGITTYLLIFTWVAAALGILFKLHFIDAPKHFGAGSYFVMGLAGAFALPTLVSAIGMTAVAIWMTSTVVLVGGVFAYVLERPNPIPHLFGFHEIFHLCITICVVMQFGVMAHYISG